MIGRIAITSEPSSSWTTHGSLDEGVGAEDRRLRLVDDRRSVEGPEAPGIRDRERAALDVVGQQLLRPCALGEILDRARGAGEVQVLRVSDHGDDQALAFLERDRDPDVDVGTRDDGETSDLAVDPRVVLEGLDRRPGDEREVREVDALAGQLRLELLAQRDDARHVDLDGARHVRGRVDGAAHVLHDPAAHRRHRLERLAGSQLRLRLGGRGYGSGSCGWCRRGRRWGGREAAEQPPVARQLPEPLPVPRLPPRPLRQAQAPPPRAEAREQRPEQAPVQPAAPRPRPSR